MNIAFVDDEASVALPYVEYLWDLGHNATLFKDTHTLLYNYRGFETNERFLTSEEAIAQTFDALILDWSASIGTPHIIPNIQSARRLFHLPPARFVYFVAGKPPRDFYYDPNTTVWLQKPPQTIQLLNDALTLADISIFSK